MSVSAPRLAALTFAFVAFASAAHAQGRGGANWSTVNADAQRTGWIRTEARISVASVQATGPKAFQLLWKVKPDASKASALSQPLILQNLISHKGFKALAFIADAVTVWAYDYDLAKVYWTTKLTTSSRPLTGPCAVGPASLTRNTPLAQSAVPGAVAPARGVGSAPAPAPPAGRGPTPGINPNNLPIGNAVWAITSGGMLHALNPHIGGDVRPPVRIIPAAAKVTGSMLVNGVLYATTSDNCSGAANGVWAIDTGETPNLRSWDSKGANIAGSAGPALGLNDVLYVATGNAPSPESPHANAAVALDSKTLDVKHWFSAAGTPFTTSPTAFNFNGRDLVAVANQDGRLYVLDAMALGGADGRSPLTRSAIYTNGADPAVGTLATWQHSDGTRWILAASRNGIVAFKLVEQQGRLELQQGWTSREMASPLPPIVLNNVVFVVSRGKNPAIHALDANNGGEIWNSGTTLTSAPTAAPAGQDGQVYVSTADGTLHAFGIPLEH